MPRSELTPRARLPPIPIPVRAYARVRLRHGKEEERAVQALRSNVLQCIQCPARPREPVHQLLPNGTLATTATTARERERERESILLLKVSEGESITSSSQS